VTGSKAKAKHDKRVDGRAFSPSEAAERKANHQVLETHPTGRVTLERATLGNSKGWMVTEHLHDGSESSRYHSRLKDARLHYQHAGEAHSADHRKPEHMALAARLKHYAKQLQPHEHSRNFHLLGTDSMSREMNDLANSIMQGRRGAGRASWKAPQYSDDPTWYEEAHTPETHANLVRSAERMEARIRSMADTGRTYGVERKRPDVRHVEEHIDDTKRRGYSRNEGERALGMAYSRGYTVERGKPGKAHREHKERSGLYHDLPEGYRVVPHGHFPARKSGPALTPERQLERVRVAVRNLRRLSA
jgi:hypothetical protein